MVGIYKDPAGETIFNKSGGTDRFMNRGIGGSGGGSLTPAVENEVLKQRARIQELEFELNSIKVGIT